MEAILQGKSFRAPGSRGDTWNYRENQFHLSSQKEERVPGGGSNPEAPEGRPIIARGKAAQRPPPWATSKQIHFSFFVIRPALKANDKKGKGPAHWPESVHSPMIIRCSMLDVGCSMFSSSTELNPRSINSQSQDQPQRVKADQRAFSVCRAPFAADPLRLALPTAPAASPCSATPASSRSVSFRVPSRCAAACRKGPPCP
jgi:hypothetical protein